MKLRTRTATYASTTLPPKDVKDIEGTLAEFKHDAAAAHALMQAISEAESEDDEFPNTYAAHIRLRADELMREWGFGEAAE